MSKDHSDIPVQNVVVKVTAETEFASYLAMINNAVDSKMFHDRFVLRDGERVNLLDSGACAYFVSSVLVIFKKIESFHGTVRSTVIDLERSGWQLVEDEKPKPGDVLVWSAEFIESVGETHAHIGFYVGDKEAISTLRGVVIKHGDRPDHKWSDIVKVYRLPESKWGPQAK